MALPDISRLSSLGPERLAALGARLREVGVDLENVGAVMKIAERSMEVLAAPLRRYHLSKRTDLVAHAMRLFAFGDAIAREQAQQVLGELHLQAFVDAGLLAGTEAIRAQFVLSCIGDQYILCDDLTHGDEAVMGVANTTADLCRAAGSHRALDRALDLGCGAGAVGISVARRSKVVVATDINPRAIEFTRVNAMLNGLTNVDARVGDMFAPVAGELFDLIVSQPPFVPQPEGTADATYLYGGRRGDELPLRLFAELPPHLAERGRAIVLVNWPVVDDDTLDGRVRRQMGDELSLLQLIAPPADLDDWCALMAFLEERSGGEAFENRARMRREHFDRLRVSALRMAFNIIERTPHRWTRSIDTLPAARMTLHGGHIDALIATSELLQASDEELLSARVRLPPDAEIIERGNRVRVVFTDWLPPVDVSRGAAMLATAANAAPTVRHAIAEVSSKVGDGNMSAQMLEGIRQAMSLGVLQAG